MQLLNYINRLSNYEYSTSLKLPERVSSSGSKVIQINLGSKPYKNADLNVSCSSTSDIQVYNNSKYSSDFEVLDIREDSNWESFCRDMKAVLGTFRSGIYESLTSDEVDQISDYVGYLTQNTTLDDIVIFLGRSSWIIKKALDFTGSQLNYLSVSYSGRGISPNNPQKTQRFMKVIRDT